MRRDVRAKSGRKQSGERDFSWGQPTRGSSLSELSAAGPARQGAAESVYAAARLGSDGVAHPVACMERQRDGFGEGSMHRVRRLRKLFLRNRFKCFLYLEACLRNEKRYVLTSAQNHLNKKLDVLESNTELK